MPWNVETPLGYFGEIHFHIITGQSYLFIYGTNVLLFIAMCLHHRAFSQMYEHSLLKLEFVAKKPNNKQFLCHLIDFHSTVKRFVRLVANIFPFNWNIFYTSYIYSWMLQSAEVYSPFVLVQLVCLTISISCIVFQFDMVTECQLFQSMFVQNVLFFNSATSTFGFWHYHHVDVVPVLYFKSIFVLLLWRNGDWKLRKNGRSLIRM